MSDLTPDVIRRNGLSPCPVCRAVYIDPIGRTWGPVTDTPEGVSPVPASPNPPQPPNERQERFEAQEQPKENQP